MKKLISLVSMFVFAFAVVAMAAQEKTTKAEKKSAAKAAHAAKAPKLSWATGTVSSASADSVTLNNAKPAGKAKEVAGATGDALTLKVDDKTKVTAAKAAADLKSGDEVRVSYHANFPDAGTNHAMSIASAKAAAKGKKSAKKPA